MTTAVSFVRPISRPTSEFATRSMEAVTAQPNGVPVGDYPSWMECSMLAVTNMVRQDPQGFLAAYMPGAGNILTPEHYPAVAPLRWALGLNQSSRFHSLDMATRDYFGHDDKPPPTRTWAERISSYWPNWALLGENVAGGFTTPLNVIIGLLADPYNGAPAPDGSGYDGHRWNIMYSQYTHVGCGYAEATMPTQYQRYFTQDFGTPQVADAETSPIYSGTHLIRTDLNETHFLCNVGGPLNGVSVFVIIDGETHVAERHLNGTWKLSTQITTVPRLYFFNMVGDDGRAWSYPQRGQFVTTGEGTVKDFLNLDINGDGVLSPADVLSFLEAWFAGDPSADLDGNGIVNQADVPAFVNDWLKGRA